MSKKQLFIIVIISVVVISGLVLYSIWQKAQKEKVLPQPEEKQELTAEEKKEILGNLAGASEAEAMEGKEKIQILGDLSKSQPKKVRPSFTDDEKKKILEALGQNY